MSIQVEVKASRHYTVQIGEGLLDAAGALLREKTAAGTACVVSGAGVAAMGAAVASGTTVAAGVLVPPQALKSSAAASTRAIHMQFLDS